MDQFTFKKFAKITKVDDEERMVYGWASTPDLDSDGETIELEALKNALPDYMKFPTVREMHQPKAAGKVKSAEIRNGKEKGLYVAAKIVSDEAWKLVKEGVYSAFSIGGNVLERIGNTIKALELIEISLVDVPANKAAVIELWKRQEINKDASGVSIFTYLMDVCRECQMIMEQRGKKTKMLDKMIEQIKQMIADEAMEPEAKEEKARKIANVLAALIKAEQKGGEQESMKKEDKPKVDPVSDEDKGAKEVVEGTEGAAVEGETPVTETPETKVEDKAEDKTEATEGEKVEGESKEGEEGEKTEGEGSEEDKSEEKTEGAEEKGAETTLEKIQKMNEELEKIGTKEVEVEKLDLTKTVNALAGTLSKVVSSLQGIEKRLAKVEATPAAVKSKAVFIQKTVGEEVVEGKTEKTSPELEAKLARKAELEKIYTDLGRNEFAKQGFAMEAGTLDKEIMELRRKSVS